MEKIKILVAAHKTFPMPLDHELYLPVLVGATNNYVSGMNYQRDDEGNNISSKNPNYNELTAVYWAWKNLQNADAVGLVHYRRYFFSGIQHKLEDVATYKDFEERLKKVDVILPKKRNYYIESNYSHYVHAHHAQPLDALRVLISKEYPTYLASFDQVMSSRGAHMFNMFVMKKPLFDEYAGWMFGILEKLEKEVDISSYDAQEARVWGYLSELMMDVWIKRNNVKYSEMKWSQIGPKHTVNKMMNFLLRKFKVGGERTHF